MAAQRPILPIAIEGTARALPKRGFVLQGRHPIRVTVLDPLPYAAFAGEEVGALTERVRARDRARDRREGSAARRGLIAALLAADVRRPSDADRSLTKIIVASSLGTLFEWYDFYLYGTLAVFFGELFFPPGNERAALLASLATFGAGFGVRPLGALVFGWVGDRVGRKYTFLVTLLTMGLVDGAASASCRPTRRSASPRRSCS